MDTQRKPNKPPTEPLVARTDAFGATGSSRFLWIVLALVLLPIAASAIQRATGGWVPEGDDAWVARRTMQVLSTDPPLIGQESTANDTPGDRGLSHPGPLAYYLMAPGYWVTGWSPVGLIVGAAMIAGAAAAASVVLAFRVGGVRLVLAAGIAITLMEGRLGQDWLVRPVSSGTVALPLMAALIGLWAYLRGDRAGLGVALLAGTYCLQTSLVVLPIAAVVLVMALAVAWWRRRQRGERVLGRPARVVIAVLVVAWIPPVAQTVLSWPGNLVELGHYLLAAAGLVHREGTTAGSVGIGAATGTILEFLVSVPRLGGDVFRGPAVWLVDVGQVAAVSVVAGLAALTATLAWAHRKRRLDLQALLLVAAGATLVAVVAFAKRPTDSLVTQTYFVVWLQPVVAVTWMAVALAGLETLARVAPRRSASGLRPAVAVGIVLVAAASLSATVGSIERHDSDRVTDLSAQIRASVPPGTYQVVGQGTIPWTSTAKGVGTDLIAHGYDIRFEEWGGLVDEPRRRGAEEIDHLLITSDYPDLDRNAMVARSTDREADIQVHLIPGGPYVPFCLEAGPAVRPMLALVGSTEQVNIGEAATLIEEVDAGRLAELAPDPPVKEAIRGFESQRPTALAALAARDPQEIVGPDTMSTSFEITLAQLLVAFGQACSSAG